MIRSFRHRGVKRLYERGDPSRIGAGHVKRIEDILARLDTADRPEILDLPGYRLHPLKGNRAGFWSVTISGNWRLIFRMSEGDAFDVELIDYH